MPIIEAQQLSKSYRVADKQPGIGGTLRHLFRRQYRHIDAVREINLAIEPGEIVGFLGPNGAGKTTTLKMLTGLIHPSAGRATVAGFTPFDRKPAFLRQISLVMGNKQQLIWDLPAIDSLRMNAAVYNVTNHDFKQRIDKLATMLEITDKLNQPVRKLSLGERMKCELLVALLHHPRVLFLDEPTLGLDINAQNTVRQFIRTYTQEHQATVLLTSHYMADITALCERVVVIHKGGLLYDGLLDGIKQRFTPYREICVELEQPVEREQLATYGEIESIDGRRVTLLIEREKLTACTARLLDDLPVVDLSIADPPIEQVIGRLFEEGHTA